jgi:hypothetical protein
MLQISPVVKRRAFLFLGKKQVRRPTLPGLLTFRGKSDPDFTSSVKARYGHGNHDQFLAFCLYLNLSYMNLYFNRDGQDRQDKKNRFTMKNMRRN